mmetsp:Transcript_75710/g.214230  ORF Transcript_75710/g.214230 Transcript_75710/m.214230 type:complete len:205 (+) Transcript_75710:45-659(+)
MLVRKRWLVPCCSQWEPRRTAAGASSRLSVASRTRTARSRRAAAEVAPRFAGYCPSSACRPRRPGPSRGQAGQAAGSTGVFCRTRSSLPTAAAGREVATTAMAGEPATQSAGRVPRTSRIASDPSAPGAMPARGWMLAARTARAVRGRMAATQVARSLRAGRRGRPAASRATSSARAAGPPDCKLTLSASTGRTTEGPATALPV